MTAATIFAATPVKDLREKGPRMIAPDFFKQNRPTLSRRHLLRVIGGAVALPIGIRGAHAAITFPLRPVRVIVGIAAGGGTDVLARLFGQYLGERLGQPFIIEN